MSGEQLLYNRPLPGARLNMSHPLALGLVGCWLLNENGGIRAMDVTPYQNNGLKVGGLGNEFSGPYFDGVDDIITTTNAHVLNITANITLSCWFRRGPTQTDYFGLIAKGGNGGYAPYVLGFNNNNKMLYLESSDGLSWTTNVGTLSAITDSLWHHAVMRNNRVNAVYFIDGVEDNGSSTVASSLYVNTAKVVIGGEIHPTTETTGRFFNGNIALACIWNRALTTLEIQQLYLSPYAPMGTKMFL